MKRIDLIAELKGLSKDQLGERKLKVAEELMKLRFQKTTGQLEQSHRLGDLRKEIARINTIIGGV